MTARWFVLACAFLCAGCPLEEKRQTVETLSFDEKKVVVDTCQTNGKMATDNYCKEVAFVYGRELLDRLQDKRVHDAQKRTYRTHIDVTK